MTDPPTCRVPWPVAQRQPRFACPWLCRCAPQPTAPPLARIQPEGHRGTTDNIPLAWGCGCAVRLQASSIPLRVVGRIEWVACLGSPAIGGNSGKGMDMTKLHWTAVWCLCALAVSAGPVLAAEPVVSIRNESVHVDMHGRVGWRENSPFAGMSLPWCRAAPCGRITERL